MMCSRSRIVRLLGLIVVLGAFGINGAAAQTYPTKTVRIVVPFAAGGLNDVLARLLQPYLEKALGQTVIVENKPGASGIIGSDNVAKSAPDGHSLLVVASSYTVVPATHPKLPYDAEKDLAPIAMVGTNPLLFIVNSKLPAKSLGEFVALAKAEPGKLNYATPGAATQTHLVAELFSQRAGIKLQHIPYRGGAPVITALVADQAQFTVISPLVSMPQIKAGNLRALAAGSLKRDPQFPDLPTVAESGYPNFEAIQWVGLLTTGSTPQPIVDRLNGIVNEALKDPEMIRKLAMQGVSPAGGSADQFRKTIATEIADWTAVADKAGIKAK
jgi:tripartite-type tricarboxylate transporter receptor subunit TctC